MAPTDYLSAILARKRREIERRHAHTRQHTRAWAPHERVREAHAALRRRPGQPPRVIAEIKRRSPSAGSLRAPARGDAQWLAREYVCGGAAAISVLCDQRGFGGSVLDLRRVAQAGCGVPVLFKEFVLDELQIELADRVGAHMVLLLVRALSRKRLHALCEAALRRNLAPVVEAASVEELNIALETRATIVGVNARDLRTFHEDAAEAQAALQHIPEPRIALHMSGVRSAADFERVSAGRADAVLIGESLMRAEQPAQTLRKLMLGVR